MIARIIFFDGISSYGPGLKLNTERITVTLCLNISGSNELQLKLSEKRKNQEHLKIFMSHQFQYFIMPSNQLGGCLHL